MIVSGIPAPLPPQRPIAPAAARPAAAPRATSAAPAAADPHSVMAPAAEAAPAGEAPTLWDLLTPEEREFFSQQSALGPLSYRPGAAAREGVPGPTGQRIDVRG